MVTIRESLLPWKQTVFEAMKMAEHGKTAAEIRDILEATKFELHDLYHGRYPDPIEEGRKITAAAAALGTLLKLKPVLDPGREAGRFRERRERSSRQSRSCWMPSRQIWTRFFTIRTESVPRLPWPIPTMRKRLCQFKEEAQAIWPDHDIMVDPMSLSVSCLSDRERLPLPHEDAGCVRKTFA